MKRLFGKWRLVRKLNGEISQANKIFSTSPVTTHVGFSVVQKQVVAVRGLFVERAVHDQHMNIANVNSLLDACVEEGYMRRLFRDGDTSTFLVTITPKGKDFCEPTNLVQAALSQFDRVWLLVVSILTYLAGKYDGKIAGAVWKLLNWHLPS